MKMNSYVLFTPSQHPCFITPLGERAKAGAAQAAEEPEAQRDHGEVEKASGADG